jgi:hypothetical protein
MSQSGCPLPRNVYNKNAYFIGNGVITSLVSTEMKTLTTAASETVKLKDSTRCLLDCPADGYNRQIQTEAEESWRRTILTARRRAEQIRASIAKKTPDRRGPKQTEEPAELAELRGDSQQTVKTNTDKSDKGRQLM